jgi:hypothetical protein
VIASIFVSAALTGLGSRCCTFQARPAAEEFAVDPLMAAQKPVFGQETACSPSGEISAFGLRVTVHASAAAVPAGSAACARTATISAAQASGRPPGPGRLGRILILSPFTSLAPSCEPEWSGARGALPRTQPQARGLVG